MTSRTSFLPVALVLALAIVASRGPVVAAQQQNDTAYTKRIRETLQDPRISTELVDHLPASRTVPTPLKVLGHIIGEPGILDNSTAIYGYFDALARTSPRVKVWRIGKTEEGRDMIIAAIADEATIKQIDRYKGMLNSLTDPRKTTEEQARALIKTAKPIYWMTSGIHSPETGGPEMLMELAYRLAVEETPYIQAIRNNVITFITPVVEVDGRDKHVDTYNFNKTLPAGATQLPLMYWGKYVQHDNNRDEIGQFLALTRHTTKAFLEWTPTIVHDLHEEILYLYTSTGTGPYNEAIDPITVHEWWLLAQDEVMEMAKRNVPGVWTFGFYDGWVPNYLFFLGNTHNAIGRFYEVGGYGPDIRTVRNPPDRTSREWFRPTPPLDSMRWGPRNNTNIQQSALLIALHRVAQDKELFLENYWIKNKRSVEKGKVGPTHAWVIPAGQRRKSDAADAVNELRHQGIEVDVAASAFRAGNVDVKAGDYIVRADQPYRTLADMYFSVQNYPPTNPAPYDDTGWTFQMMRDVVVTPCTDRSILTQGMRRVTEDVRAPGGVEGTGNVIVVDHTGDDNVVSFRYRLGAVAMQAAEADFDASGRHFRAGAFILPNANRAQVEPVLRELGLSGYAMASAPTVRVHDLVVPRVGYIHTWTRTQDEGWVRAALDTYGIPYAYFADNTVKAETNLRAKYDVIIFPHTGGPAASVVAGLPMTGAPLPYKHTASTLSLGTPDSSSDIRGGLGIEGVTNLYKFVQEGGTLIVEGSTSTLFPDYHLAPGITVETPQSLFVRGSIMRGVITDMTSPLVYGIAENQIPVYFNSGPVLNAGGAPDVADAGTGPRFTPTLAPVQAPMSTPLKLSPWTAETNFTPTRAAAQEGRGGGRGADPASMFLSAAGSAAPRVVMRFPANPDDMLLSGSLANGQVLSNRAQLVDEQIGKGHVVMFAIRPYWRWQTQGTYVLGFNALLNWNHLDAGRPGT